VVKPLYESDTIHVVIKRNFVHREVLFLVLLLLELENVIDEQTLKLLVGKVNAELLE
jgi:hypothetical protein